MSPDWLAVQSFGANQRLLTAINDLSIHTKLRLGGVDDPGRSQAAADGRKTLEAFLYRLDTALGQSGEDELGPVLGTDPRLRELARSFVAARRDRGRFRSVLFRQSPSEMEQLLRSGKPEDEKLLVECLKELRALVEDHLHSDAAEVLGEI